MQLQGIASSEIANPVWLWVFPEERIVKGLRAFLSPDPGILGRALSCHCTKLSESQMLGFLSHTIWGYFRGLWHLSCLIQWFLGRHIHSLQRCNCIEFQRQITLEAFESPDPSIFGGTLQQAPSWHMRWHDARGCLEVSILCRFTMLCNALQCFTMPYNATWPGDIWGSTPPAGQRHIDVLPRCNCSGAFTNSQGVFGGQLLVSLTLQAPILLSTLRNPT